MVRLVTDGVAQNVSPTRYVCMELFSIDWNISQSQQLNFVKQLPPFVLTLFHPCFFFKGAVHQYGSNNDRTLEPSHLLNYVVRWNQMKFRNVS